MEGSLDRRRQFSVLTRGFSVTRTGAVVKRAGDLRAIFDVPLTV
jgi:hypothetical protein